MLQMAPTFDPRAEVEAPVRRAIDGLIMRSGVEFGAAVLAVILTIETSEGPLHSVGHFALPGLLLLILATRTVQLVLRRDGVPTDTAWARAREITPRDAGLATFVTSMVPVGWFVGGGAILLRHVGQVDLATLVCIVAPLAATLWLITTIAWAQICRDRLARAIEESERRFRKYWQQVPGEA